MGNLPPIFGVENHETTTYSKSCHANQCPPPQPNPTRPAKLRILITNALALKGVPGYRIFFTASFSPEKVTKTQ